MKGGEKRGIKRKHSRETESIKQPLSKKNPSSISKHNKVSTFSVFSKNFSML